MHNSGETSPSGSKLIIPKLTAADRKTALVSDFQRLIINMLGSQLMKTTRPIEGVPG